MSQMIPLHKTSCEMDNSPGSRSYVSFAFFSFFPPQFFIFIPKWTLRWHTRVLRSYMLCWKKEEESGGHGQKLLREIQLLTITWMGTSLAVHWLRLHSSNAGDAGLIPGQGTRGLHAVWCSKKKKKKNYRDNSMTTTKPNWFKNE